MTSPVTGEKLRQVKEVYSHAHCPDGLSSAMIVKAAYSSIGLSPNIEFVQYDTADHDRMTPRPHQLFVDITPPKKRWEEWRELDPIVLDHHDTVKHVTEGLGGVYGGENDSGASLAFKHVFRSLFKDSLWNAADVANREAVLEKWAKFAFLCMLRDTWKDGHEQWRDAASLAQSLSFYTPKPMLEAATKVDFDFDEMLRFGRVLYKKVEWKAIQAARGSYFEHHAGKKFGYFNCTEKIISEACHELLEKHDCDVAVAFFSKMEDGRYDLSLSLRSKKPEKGGVPVNKMAEFWSGGGHAPAAGFRIKDAMNVPFSEVVQRVRDAYDSLP